VTQKFVYSLEAQAELREIVRHTARQWGAAQARSYARQIDEAAGDLATGEGFFKDWGQLLPGLRVKAAGQGAEADGEVTLLTGVVPHVCVDGKAGAPGLDQFSTRLPFTMIGFPVAWEYSTSGHISAPFGQVMEPSSGSTRT
jgi:plasmid stabilization system protein ParE